MATKFRVKSTDRPQVNAFLKNAGIVYDVTSEPNSSDHGYTYYTYDGEQDSVLRNLRGTGVEVYDVKSESGISRLKTALKEARKIDEVTAASEKIGDILVELAGIKSSLSSAKSSIAGPQVVIYNAAMAAVQNAEDKLDMLHESLVDADL